MAGAIEQKKVEDHWSRFLKLQLNVFAVRYDIASGEVVRYKRLVWMFAYLITDTIVSIGDTETSSANWNTPERNAAGMQL